MIELFHKVSKDCSRITTQRYSTSFSSAIRLLHKDLRHPVYNIYGFVRFADEIVDTFHEHNKSELLAQFKKETYDAIERGISMNSILNYFQIKIKELNWNRVVYVKRVLFLSFFFHRPSGCCIRICSSPFIIFMGLSGLLMKLLTLFMNIINLNYWTSLRKKLMMLLREVLA